MELISDCIVCLNEKQCLKPCSCTARVCVACIVRICASDTSSEMACPQCRSKINKEDFGIPKMDLDLTHFITTTVLRSSMLFSPPPRPPLQLDFENITPLRIDDLEPQAIPITPRVCVVCNEIIRTYQRGTGNIVSGICSSCYDEINRDRETVSNLSG